jgi:hypothetical protein
VAHEETLYAQAEEDMARKGTRCSKCSKTDRLLMWIRGAALCSTPPLISLTLLIHEVRGFVG